MIRATLLHGDASEPLGEFETLDDVAAALGYGDWTGYRVEFGVSRADVLAAWVESGTFTLAPFGNDAGLELVAA